jgi:maleylacetoacetate isomerase
MKLYSYSRSSASFRVRIAAYLKGLTFEYAAVNLAKGESRTSAYEAINPLGKVPALEDDGALLTQSLAICEYLEEKHPNPPLLPRDLVGRARVRALALAVACEIHPVGGGRAQSQLAQEFKASPEQRAEWGRYWMAEGFAAIEKMLAGSPQTGRFCHGDTPTIADVFIVPQVYNALQAKLDMQRFPTIQRIYDECMKVEAFDRARPEKQPDAS